MCARSAAAVLYVAENVAAELANTSRRALVSLFSLFVQRVYAGIEAVQPSVLPVVELRAWPVEHGIKCASNI
jgi:hypothetical protein